MHSILPCLLLVALATRPVGARGAEPMPAYPPSPVIEGLDWAPVETIIGRAHDGDNRPVTWADDNALSNIALGDGIGTVRMVGAHRANDSEWETVPERIP